MPFRRSYDRLKLNLPATLIVNKNEQEQLTLKDLSARGVGVLVKYPLAVNQAVGIVITTSFFNAPVFKEAKVSWSKKVGEDVSLAGLDFGVDNTIELPPAAFGKTK